MQFLMTQGLGSAGDGTGSAMLITTGMGTAGSAQFPACLALQVLDVTNLGPALIATFSNNLVVSGPGLDPTKYVFTGPTQIAATLIEIVPPGHLLKIHITEQQQGGNYTVTLPEQGIMDVNGNLINGPFTSPFIGIGSPVTVQIVKSIDQRTLEIVFSEAVLEADAIIPANYSITPTLTVQKAERITDFHYRLTTSSQTFNTTYAVTISNIRDIHGNL
jgi:hypothetical protein